MAIFPFGLSEAFQGPFFCCVIILTRAQLESLRTVGPVIFPDTVGGQLSTAHPHYTRDGRVVNFVTQFGRSSEFVVFALPKEACTLPERQTTGVAFLARFSGEKKASF